MINYNFKSEILKADKFDIKINGIQLIENDNNVEIRVDVFRSQPVFLYRDLNQNIYVFDSMDFFYSQDSFSKNIDEVGFWEIMLFGTSLWTRTLYVDLFQLPSASSLIINKKTKDFTIKRYWDFNVYINPDIKSLDIAAEKFNSYLDRISSNLDPNQNYCFGLSGGMDSRLTLAYLSKYIKPERLNIFTYANSNKSLEHILSKEICKRLNLNEPSFHSLTGNSYKEALNYMPKKSGGQIGINHCHIIDFLSKQDLGDLTHISTYFSDAIFGFECEIGLDFNDKMYNPYISKLNNSPFISDEIKNQIADDSNFITKDYDLNSNISSLKEYIYVSERNQKFHNYLFSIQKEFTKKGCSFYHDYNLFVYSLSIPIEFRNQKKIEYYILEKYYRKISASLIGDISSIYFRSSNNFDSFVDVIKFKFLNRINALLRIFTRGYFQVENNYQTEELERNLYKYFKTDLIKAFKVFYDMGIFKKKHTFFKKLPIKSNGVNERYRIISLATLFRGI